MDGGDGDDGDGVGEPPDSPASFDEIERPPLRHVDKYCRAEVPCMSTRYTVAMMTCIGFIISFGIRCNLSMAKLTLADIVSRTGQVCSRPRNCPESHYAHKHVRPLSTLLHRVTSHRTGLYKHNQLTLDSKQLLDIMFTSHILSSANKTLVTNPNACTPEPKSRDSL